MNEPIRAESDTYTPARMDSTFRGVQPDVSSRSFEPVSHAADEVRGMVQALLDGHTDINPDDVMGHLARALLEAHEQERQRLAEELHDGPAQAFANAIFQTEILERAIRDDPQLADAELVSLRQILERELDTLRGYINQLRPSLGEAEGLDEALRDSAAAISQRSGMPVDVSIGAPGAQLNETARTVVLRVAQEALRNIAKHSGASRAWLVTRFTDDPSGSRKWQLEVGDDGKGFDIDEVTAHRNRRHFGLRFMKERADMLGSELTFTSDMTTGTVVRLTTDIGG
jgi:two-component system, NarL family, sensor histidine kinase DegS